MVLALGATEILKRKTEVYFFKGLPRARLLCLFIHLILSTPSTFFSNFKTFMASSSGAVVEYSNHHLKVKDSSLAATVGTGRDI